MQGIQQKLPSVLTGFLSAQNGKIDSTAGLKTSQVVELKGDGQSPEFLDTLLMSLQGLLDSGQLNFDGEGGEQALAVLQGLLGQELALGGELLPLGEAGSLSLSKLVPEELTPDVIQAVLDQIKLDQAENPKIDPNVLLAPGVPGLMPLQERLNKIISIDVQKSSAVTKLAHPLLSRDTVSGETPDRSPILVSASVMNAVVVSSLMDEQKLFANVRQQVGGESAELLVSSHSASLAKPLAATTGTDARPVVTQSFIALPMSDPRWQGELNNRIAVMAKAAMLGQPQVAEIRLNPASMGPIDIRVIVKDDGQASVSFSAQQGVTREAIENSLPRLRELFNGSGLVLADADVSDQAPNYTHQSPTGEESESIRSGNDADIEMNLADGLLGAGVNSADLSLVRGLDLFV